MTQLAISCPPTATGLFWIKEGWRIFKLAPVPWMGMTALVLMINNGFALLGLIGLCLSLFLSPYITAGYMSASRSFLADEPVTFIHLGVGLHIARGVFLKLGWILFICSLCIFALLWMTLGDELNVLMQQVEKPAALTEQQAQLIASALMPILFWGSLLFTPLLMATLFAPSLVLFDAFPAGRALWWSLWACWVNWRPILYYSLILGAFSMVALIIPYGLGMLVFMPVTLISTYVAYRMIFTRVTDSELESAS